MALVALKLAPQECHSSRVRGNRARATRSGRAGEVSCVSFSLRGFATPSSTKKSCGLRKDGPSTKDDDDDARLELVRRPHVVEVPPEFLRFDRWSLVSSFLVSK